MNHVKVELKKSFDGHSHTTLSALFFGYPHNKVVSCSMDSEVKVFDSETTNLLATFTEHNRIVRHLIKWDDNTFISSGDGGRVVSYSIHPNIQVKKRFDDMFQTLSGKAVIRLLKINEDELLLVVAPYQNKFISIISYSEGKELRRFPLNHSPVYCMNAVPVKSVKFKDCFYLPTEKEGIFSAGPIKLINYMTGKVEKEFDEHLNKTEKPKIVRGLSLYFDKKGKENLICSCYNPNEILIYDVLTSKLKKTIGHGDQSIYSATMIYNRWLCIGEGFGGISVYDADNYFVLISFQQRYSSYRRTLTHTSSVEYLGVAEMKDTVHLISCSSDETVRLSDTGIKTKKKVSPLETQDLKERRDFLFDWVSDERGKERNKIFKKISTTNKSFYIFQNFIILE